MHKSDKILQTSKGSKGSCEENDLIAMLVMFCLRHALFFHLWQVFVDMLLLLRTHSLLSLPHKVQKHFSIWFM